MNGWGSVTLDQALHSAGTSTGQNLREASRGIGRPPSAHKNDDIAQLKKLLPGQWDLPFGI